MYHAACSILQRSCHRNYRYMRLQQTFTNSNLRILTVEPWLLFTQRVPATQSSARVRAWRSLREIGALSTRNAVYILPNLQRCRDDFERVRVENLAAGGEATVFVGRPLDASEHDRLIELFRRTSSEGY